MGRKLKEERIKRGRREWAGEKRYIEIELKNVNNWGPFYRYLLTRGKTHH
jgi:hypothetical protein